MTFKRINYFLSLLVFSSFYAGITLSQDAEEFFSRTPPEYNPPGELLGWIDSREYQSLNGKWHYIIDPMNNGLPEESFLEASLKTSSPVKGLN